MGSERPEQVWSAGLGTGRRQFIEFFSGIGLVHEALSSFGWTCALANDIDARKMNAYRLNFPNTRVATDDVRDLRASALPSALLATASFPCIDLSQAGARTGIHGEHSGVVWAFLDHIRALSGDGRAPRFLLLENVPGLLTLHNGASIDLLLRELASLGYAYDLVQVDARHFTPQARNRVFIIAIRDQDLAERTPMPDTLIRRYKVRHVYERNPGLPWVFFNFPDLPDRILELSDVLEDVPGDHPAWWSEERLDYFWQHLEHDHRRRLEDLVQARATGNMTAVRRGRRRGQREQIFNLRFDGLASCLRTPKGGSSIQFVVQLDLGQVRVRRILGIESARLQGVCLPGSAPDFVPPVGEQAALYGFGDGVCVPVVRWVVAHSIEALLAGRPPRMADNTQLELSVLP